MTQIDSAGPSDARPFAVKVWAPGIGLVVDFAEDRDTWYSEGWSAQRVAVLLYDHASVWRAEQVYEGGADALDEERVTALEAGELFFTLLARLERREYVSVEELTTAIAWVSRSANGVILEETWDASGAT